MYCHHLGIEGRACTAITWEQKAGHVLPSPGNRRQGMYCHHLGIEGRACTAITWDQKAGHVLPSPGNRRIPHAIYLNCGGNYVENPVALDYS